MSTIWDSFVGVLTSLIIMMYRLTQVMGFPNYGLAIIFFTIILRVLMFPLNLMQAKSSRVISLLQPRVSKLQQQYKSTPEILNRETQALYKKYEANPLSGCLPLLIQMPILFALFSAMRGFEYVGEGATFLWMSNLSEPDPTGIVLPVIVGLSSYLQSKLTMETQPAVGDQAKTMNTMMLYGMPVMLGWTTRNFAAGVAIYWSVFNTLGFLMQILINALVGNSLEGFKTRIEEDEAKELEEAKKAEERKKREAERRREADRQRATERKKSPQNKNKKKSTDGSSRGKALDFDLDD